MAILDRIMQMQQQGMSDNDIVYMLQNEGISSRDINDALSQAKIKSAVNQPSSDSQGYQESYPTQQTTDYGQPTQQQYAPQYYQQPQQGYSDQYYDPNAQGQQGYDNQMYYPEQTQNNTQLVSDIVDRLLIEKLKDTNQKIKTISEFKIRAEEDIADLKDRVKKIESVIENLQRSVINKVGEFGQSTALIHRDLENLHGTVSKLMNPLVDNYNELKKINSKK